MNTVILLAILFFLGGCIVPRSKFVCFLIILFVWVLNINISNPDYIPLREAYESAPYGEIGYRYLCEFFNARGVDFLVFKMGIVAVALLLLYRFIIRYSEMPALVAAIYLVICPLDFVQYRNFFAFCILINALPLLGNLSKRNILFFLTVLFLAGSVHASIFVFLFALLLQKDVFSYIKKSNGAILLLSIIILPLLYYLFFFFVDDEVTSRSQAYFIDSTSIVTKVGVMILCSLVYFVVNKYQRYVRFQTMMSTTPQSSIVYNPNHFIITLSLLFFLLIPIIMFNITYLRLVRFVVFMNIVFMLNVKCYTKRGSYLVILCYSMISLLIGYVLHQDTFINEVIRTFYYENLFIR